MRATVLVVDDERMIRVSVRRILESHGYGVIEAPNGLEALRVLREGDTPVDLIVTDVRMPGMSGIELIKQVDATNNLLPVIYISGYSVDPEIEALSNAGNRRVLPKPFFPATLMSAVQGALVGRS